MADDDGGDPILITQQRRPKEESKLGNFLEFCFSYGTGLTIYTPFHIILLFLTGTSLNTPEAQAVMWPIWIAVSLFHWGANGWAANEGTKAKFTSKTFRLFADFICSALPITLVPLMVILAALGIYKPEPIHWLIALFMTAVCLIELLSNSNLVHTAIRRVREGALDH